MSDMDINKMDFKQLRSEVQLLRDELAVFKRKFNDVAYNIDTDNFGKAFTAEHNGMKAQLRVTAESIESVVSDLVNYSKITQTADMIQSVVSKTVDLKNAVAITSLDKATDTTKIYALQEKSGGKVVKETYYYYNDVVKRWEIVTGNTINTVFEQTSSGFKMRGNVVISGNLITEGTISGDRIEGGTLVGTTIKTSDTGAHATLNSNGLRFYDDVDQREGWSIEPNSNFGGVFNFYHNGGKAYTFGSDIAGASYTTTDMVIKALSGNRGRFVVDVGNSAYEEVKFVGLNTLGGTNSPCIYANEQLLATQNWVRSQLSSGTA